MVADGCNSVKLNITPDEIQAIFITYPSGTSISLLSSHCFSCSTLVKAKHAQLVPDQVRDSHSLTMNLFENYSL